MAKSYPKGTFDFPSNFNVNLTAPLDNRLVVDSIEDLTNDTLKLVAYVGMVVSVKGSDSLYVLTEVNDDEAMSPKTWKEIKGGESVESGIQGVQSALESVYERIESTIEGVQGDLSTSIEGVQTQIKSINDALTELDGKHDTDIAGVQTQLAGEVAKILGSDTLSKDLDSIKEIADWIGGHQAEYSDLQDLVNGNLAGVQGQLKGVQDAIEGTIKGVQDAIEDTIEGVQGQLSGVQTSLEGSLKELKESVDGDISEKLTGIQTQLSGVQTSLNNYVSGVQGQLEGVQSAIEETLNELDENHKIDIVGVQVQITELVNKHNSDVSGVQGEFSQGLSALRTELLGSGEIEETLDTIEEIADWIKGHQGEYNSLLDLQSKGVQGVQSQLTTLEEKHDEEIAGVQGQIEDATYFSTIAADDWKTDAFGGISSGLTPSAFEGKTISEVLDMILWPTKQPSKTEPSVSITYKSNSTSGQVIVMRAGTNLPQESEFTGKVVSLGTSTYGNLDKTKDLSDGVNSENMSITDNVFGATTVEKAYTVTYTVNFKAGRTLADNKGAAATTAPYAGGNKTATKIFHPIYPIYVNTVSINTMTQQADIDYLAGSKTVTIDSLQETASNKLEVHVPTSVNLKVVPKNGVTGAFEGVEDMLLTGTQDYDGVTYNKYVRNNTTNAGPSQYQLVITKK